MFFHLHTRKLRLICVVCLPHRVAKGTVKRRSPSPDLFVIERSTREKRGEKRGVMLLCERERAKDRPVTM